jgi:hypothetical protein
MVTWVKGLMAYASRKDKKKRVGDVGIDHRLLLGSTIDSFADQPSALLPINRRLYHL